MVQGGELGASTSVLEQGSRNSGSRWVPIRHWATADGTQHILCLTQQAPAMWAHIQCQANLYGIIEHANLYNILRKYM
jgi:hypothetical protein